MTILDAAAILVVLAARAVAVGVPFAVLDRFMTFSKGAYPILVWGGISIALALGLPPGPIKVTILTATYVVVVFSVIVQGSTVGKAARRFAASGE